MQDVYERYEVKYMLTAEQRERAEAVLERTMEPDPFGKSTIRNIYYDTPDFRLIRRSLEKPAYKEKLRVRSYKTVSSGEEVFVELKKKACGVVYKRRITMPEKEAMRYLAGAGQSLQDSQIGRELDYFRRYYQNLVPQVFLNYDRCACFCRTDRNLRISFDEKIQWRTNDLSLCCGPGGRDILPEGCSLMEIKTAGPMPMWLVSLLDAEKLRKTSFSKYGTAYRTMLAEGAVEFLKQLAAGRSRAGVAAGIIMKEGAAYA